MKTLNLIVKMTILIVIVFTSALVTNEIANTEATGAVNISNINQLTDSVNIVLVDNIEKSTAIESSDEIIIFDEILVKFVDKK